MFLSHLSLLFQYYGKSFLIKDIKCYKKSVNIQVLKFDARSADNLISHKTTLWWLDCTSGLRLSKYSDKESLQYPFKCHFLVKPEVPEKHNNQVDSCTKTELKINRIVHAIVRKENSTLL